MLIPSGVIVSYYNIQMVMSMSHYHQNDKFGRKFLKSQRHLYLRERLMSIQTKIINASPSSYEAIVKQERENFDATRQRIQELQNDLWQDQLFSAAQNEQQEKEIKKLMQNWGKSSYDSVAHCIVDHANRHGFAKNKLKYLRKAAI